MIRWEIKEHKGDRKIEDDMKQKTLNISVSVDDEISRYMGDRFGENIMNAASNSLKGCSSKI